MTRCCNRRAFLGAGTAGASVLALTACSGGADDEQSGRWVSITLDQPLEVGGSRSVAHQDQQLLLHRPSEEEVLAFSAVCPHQGCTVGIEQGHFECPCHGSRFELSGQWQSGPAEQALTQYEAELDEAQLDGGAVRVRL